jgi:hypothetical protein
MTYFSSNELTGGHGVSPIDRPIAAIPKFTRAFLVYIRMATGPATSPEAPFLRIRQFYHDYGSLGIDTPEELIEQVCTIGRKSDIDETGDLNPDIGQVAGFSTRDSEKPGYERAPFPYVFASGFDEVNFGWTPCHVIFVFDNPDFQFVSPDAPDSLNQPVVFRKNKAIEDSGGNWVAGGPYEENKSFFNLTSQQAPDRSYSYLMMENHMKEGKHQTPIAAHRPTVGDPQPDWPVWNYCMDINVRIPMGRKSFLLGENAGAKTVGTATSWLTVVFDPPQNNGNGGGPG